MSEVRTRERVQPRLVKKENYDLSNPIFIFRQMPQHSCFKFSAACPRRSDSRDNATNRGKKRGVRGYLLVNKAKSSSSGGHKRIEIPKSNRLIPNQVLTT